MRSAQPSPWTRSLGHVSLLLIKMQRKHSLRFVPDVRGLLDAARLGARDLVAEGQLHALRTAERRGGRSPGPGCPLDHWIHSPATHPTLHFPWTK